MNDNDHINIQSRIKRLGRSQRYLAKVFRRPESHISLAIHGTAYPVLRGKILVHLGKLESQREETK